MKLKKMMVFFSCLLAMTTAYAAEPLNPDTFVQPLMQIRFPSESSSLFFSLKDFGTVNVTVNDFQYGEFVGTTPHKTEERVFSLSAPDLEKVTPLIKQLRYAKTMTQRFPIFCLAMPNPLYTSFLKIREGSKEAAHLLTMEYKVGPCPREITQLVDEADVQAKIQLIEILKSYL
jgi:hypothetical protein